VPLRQGVLRPSIRWQLSSAARNLARERLAGLECRYRTAPAPETHDSVRGLDDPAIFVWTEAVADGIDDCRAVGFERPGSLLDDGVSAAYPPYPPRAELLVVLGEVPTFHARKSIESWRPNFCRYPATRHASKRYNVSSISHPENPRSVAVPTEGKKGRDTFREGHPASLILQPWKGTPYLVSATLHLRRPSGFSASRRSGRRQGWEHLSRSPRATSSSSEKSPTWCCSGA
jgi:hypothetical protein